MFVGHPLKTELGTSINKKISQYFTDMEVELESSGRKVLSITCTHPPTFTGCTAAEGYLEVRVEFDTLVKSVLASEIPEGQNSLRADYRVSSQSIREIVGPNFVASAGCSTLDSETH